MGNSGGVCLLFANAALETSSPEIGNAITAERLEPCLDVRLRPEVQQLLTLELRRGNSIICSLSLKQVT